MSNAGAYQIFELATDLGQASGRLASALFDVYQETGEDFREQWATNARATSGEAGKHYPNSIETRTIIARDIIVDVGPNPSKPQGGMSFEFGSKNQPPHLDGARAMPAAELLLSRRVDTAVGFLLR